MIPFRKYTIISDGPRAADTDGAEQPKLGGWARRRVRMENRAPRKIPIGDREHRADRRAMTMSGRRTLANATTTRRDQDGVT